VLEIYFIFVVLIIYIANFSGLRVSRGQRFSRPEPLIFFQVAPQLSSRGWVDPVSDPLLLTKSGIARNWTRASVMEVVYDSVSLQTDFYLSIVCTWRNHTVSVGRMILLITLSSSTLFKVCVECLAVCTFANLLKMLRVFLHLSVAWNTTALSA
jgi:hypothetical protein